GPDRRGRRRRLGDPPAGAAGGARAGARAGGGGGGARAARARRGAARRARARCVVEVGADGAIASMAFAGLPPERGGGLLWATTEFVAYGVPVEIPDLLARGAAGGRRARGP